MRERITAMVEVDKKKERCYLFLGVHLPQTRIRCHFLTCASPSLAAPVQSQLKEEHFDKDTLTKDS